MSEILSSLAMAHADRPAIVMGGAPSLIEELQWAARTVDPCAVRISANQHGAMLLSRLGMETDYFVCTDEVHQVTKQPMKELCREVSDAPIISQRFGFDIRMNNFESFGLRLNSGFLALLAAWFLGCRPIMAVGFGGYGEGTGTYWHDPQAESSGRTKPPGHFESQAIALRMFLRARQVVRVPPGSPLERVFGSDPNTIPESGCMPWHLQTYVGQRVQLRKWRVGGHPLAVIGQTLFQTGDEVMCTRTESAPLIKAGWLV